jgi:hypothetical protein
MLSIPVLQCSNNGTEVCFRNDHESTAHESIHMPRIHSHGSVQAVAHDEVEAEIEKRLLQSETLP